MIIFYIGILLIILKAAAMVLNTKFVILLVTFILGNVVGVITQAYRK